MGTDCDTSASAVNAIGTWWARVGRERYPAATEFLITADGGGSHESQRCQWKTELRGLADNTRLSISVSHFPPGTRKWNRIELRIFSHITQHWRGRPLRRLVLMVNLIDDTRARIETSDAELEAVQLDRNSFHGSEDRTTHPRP